MDTMYSIFSRDKDRYLRGDGYKSWVNFFIPFNGGIGFHDASWRSTFGGNIYMTGLTMRIKYAFSECRKEAICVTLDKNRQKVAGKAQKWRG